MHTVELAEKRVSYQRRTLRSQLERGFRLGDYQLLEQIGFGGEAEIWSGWDELRQRVVALKVILNQGETPYYTDQLSNDFAHQVRVVAGLKHSHVLPLYEFGQTEQFFYFVMRYCCGGSLSDLLLHGPLSLDEAFFFTAQISSALNYLHAQSVVHRDLKPGNILLDSQRRPYLADFGLAKRLAMETSPLHTGRGTGVYAPFEQHALQNIQPQSDIFSLGILIYEMLTGRLPWDGSAMLAERQYKSQELLPDPRDINPDLPVGLVGVLRQMTAFHWQARPQTAGEAFTLLLNTLPPEKQARFAAAHQVPLTLDEPLYLAQDADFIRQQAQPDYERNGSTFPVRLTQFALMDSVYAAAEQYQMTVDAALAQFMLRGALLYDYNLLFWWGRVSHLRHKADVCEQTILYEESAVAARALNYLLNEPQEQFTPGLFSPTVLEQLLDLAMNAPGWHVRNLAFKLVDRATPSAKRWQPVALSLEADKKLAQLALSQSSQGTQAAQLIGRARSQLAVATMVKAQTANGEQAVLDSLQIVQEVAGRLPGVVPRAMRRQVWQRRAREQLREDRDGFSWARLFIGLAVGLLLFLFMGAGLFAQPEAQLQDILLQPYTPSGIVTIVEVNDASLARYGRWDSWPRAYHAALVDQLNELGARVIVFDFVFDTETGDDALLAAAMRQAGNVVQPVLGVGDAYHDLPGTARYEQRVLPQAELLAAAAAVGHTNILHDADGVVRRLPLMMGVNGESYPSIALAALSIYLGINPAAVPVPENGRLAFAGREIPVQRSGQMSIYYAGPPGQSEPHTFPLVPYQAVLDGVADPALFQGKIVLVGITATAEPDRYLTPVSRGRPMYGVEILANAMETIWSRRFIRHAPLVINGVMVLLLAAVTSLLVSRPRSGLIFTTVLMVGYFLGATWLFDGTGLALSIFFPWLAILLSYSAATFYRYSLASRQHREMRQLFATRLSPSLAAATMAAVRKGEIDLGGRDQDLSVLLVQIEGHAQFAERHGPEALVALVHRWREFVVAAAFAFEGTLVDHRSDQFMVLFNTPLPQADHARRAARAALEIRASLQQYQQTLPPEHPHRRVNLCYGLSTGNGIVGYSGTAPRYVYTALGEVINQAEQLVAAAAPGQVLADKRIYQQATDLVTGNPLPTDNTPFAPGTVIALEPLN